MNFSTREISFSRYGSFLTFSHQTEGNNTGETLYLQSIHGEPEPHRIFKVELIKDGKVVEFTEIASPTSLRLEGDGCYISICIPEPNVIRIKGKGAGVRFEKFQSGLFDYANEISEKKIWEVNSESNRMKYMFTTLSGELNVKTKWNGLKHTEVIIDFVPENNGGEFEGVIEEYTCTFKEKVYDGSFEECEKKVNFEYKEWLRNTIDIPKEYAEAREEAAYITWSSMVLPNGFLKRPTMYMSKNWMTSVWSWDNCFNAIALSYKNPELAWEQFMIPFDYQDSSGMLMDSVNDRGIVWNFTKPPIHGWTLKKLMLASDYVDKSHLEKIYKPLCKWTEWWFKYRNDNKDGIPHYNHGNECGWDNSTVFREVGQVKSPDLSAFLVTQMDVLAEIAMILDMEEESSSWKRRADELTDKLLQCFWKDNKFVAMKAKTGELIEEKCLLLYMPVILGDRLPKDVRDKLLSNLFKENNFLTENGLATESTNSEYYLPNGYWRGPIWAPATMLIVDGLNSIGRVDWAIEVSRRFCNMVSKHGMAENFDAIAGDGLCDLAYTWTSSVFLVLAHEYLL